jgi:predicted RNase H-like HicB family nuclease
MQEFNIITEAGEDGNYISEVRELPGCHTQAKSMNERIKRTKEAIVLYLECQDKPQDSIKRFIGLHKITVKNV